jgi:hypothetical protein
MSAAAPITTPAGIHSGIAVTKPASAAAIRMLRALGAPVNARTAPANASATTAMVRTPPTPAITSSARGESPLSMLNALKRPAKSSWASGIGIALAAPSAASALAAMRFPVTGSLLWVSVMPRSLFGRSRRQQPAGGTLATG